MGINVVTHIELYRSGDRRSAIRRIHGRTDGRLWSYSEPEAIRMILGPWPKYTFWVLGMSQRAALVIVAGVWPRLFLKTDADGIAGNNLLALPEWPYAA